MAKTPSVSEVIAARVRKYRQARGWSVRQLAEECAKFGATTLTQASLTNIERGLAAKAGRGSRAVTVEELLILAVVLSVPPVTLMLPFGEHNAVEFFPGTGTDLLNAVRWIVGSDAARKALTGRELHGDLAPLYDRASEDLRRLGEIEQARDAAAWEYQLLHGDPQPLVKMRRHLDGAVETEPSLRPFYEYQAKRNNRPLPGLPISDDVWVAEFRKGREATYEKALRNYAELLWRAHDDGFLIPIVPRNLRDALVALESKSSLTPEEPEDKLAPGRPASSRPILPPDIEVHDWANEVDTRGDR